MNYPRRPMLCASGQPTDEQLERLFAKHHFLIVQDKFDGIRCLHKAGIAWSRKLLPLPNKFLQWALATLQLPVDGEIVAEDPVFPNRQLDFNSTQSRVMTEEGSFLFTYHIFDLPEFPDDYQGRLIRLSKAFSNGHGISPHIEVHQGEYVFNIEQLLAREADALDRGMEGIVVKAPGAAYKEGRSTMGAGPLWRRKPFEDQEATIIGMQERMENLNPPKINALGLQERSSHGINLRPTGELGAFVCHNDEWGVFNVSPGNLTQLQRCKIFQEGMAVHGDATITYKFQRNHSKDKPHSAQFKCFRHELA